MKVCNIQTHLGLIDIIDKGRKTHNFGSIFNTFAYEFHTLDITIIIRQYFQRVFLKPDLHYLLQIWLIHSKD